MKSRNELNRPLSIAPTTSRLEHNVASGTAGLADRVGPAAGLATGRRTDRFGHQLLEQTS